MAQLANTKQMSSQVSRGSADDYQADEQEGVPWLSFRSMKQMSRQVSGGSPGDDQGDEEAGVAQLSWEVSGK